MNTKDEINGLQQTLNKIEKYIVNTKENIFGAANVAINVVPDILNKKQITKIWDIYGVTTIYVNK